MAAQVRMTGPQRDMDDGALHVSPDSRSERGANPPHVFLRPG